MLLEVILRGCQEPFIFNSSQEVVTASAKQLPDLLCLVVMIYVAVFVVQEALTADSTGILLLHPHGPLLLDAYPVECLASVVIMVLFALALISGYYIRPLPVLPPARITAQLTLVEVAV